MTTQFLHPMMAPRFVYYLVPMKDQFLGSEDGSELCSLIVSHNDSVLGSEDGSTLDSLLGQP